MLRVTKEECVTMTLTDAIVVFDDAQFDLETKLNTLHVAIAAGDDPEVVLRVANALADDLQAEHERQWEAVTAVLNLIGELNDELAN